MIATNTQKHTVYALARLGGVGPIEEFALRMARYFVDKYSQVSGSRQGVEEYSWNRITTSDTGPHDHAFTSGSAEIRTTVVTKHGADEVVISGLRELTMLKSTGSEFHGVPQGRRCTRWVRGCLPRTRSSPRSGSRCPTSTTSPLTSHSGA